MKGVETAPALPYPPLGKGAGEVPVPYRGTLFGMVLERGFRKPSAKLPKQLLSPTVEPCRKVPMK